MLRSVRGRLAGLAVLAVMLAILPVWFGSLAPAPELGAYPSSNELGPNYDRYVGEQVEVAGEIVSTDPIKLRTNYGADEHAIYTVTNVDGSVEPGAELRVFGVAKPGGVIEAREVVVVPQSGYLWAYGVSAVAGLWVLARVTTDWRFDRGEMGLVPRMDGGGGDA